MVLGCSPWFRVVLSVYYMMYSRVPLSGAVNSERSTKTWECITHHQSAIMNNLTTTNVSSMSSREIAELVESRHDAVKRSIERLVKRGAIPAPSMRNYGYINSLGIPCSGKEYQVGKRDSYVIVAQLSPEFTGRIVDRWQELEAQAVKPDDIRALAALEAHLKAASLFACPLHLAQVESVKQVKLAYGVDFSTHLLSAPAQHNIAKSDVMLEPTELGKLLGLSGQSMNLNLLNAGLQVRTSAGWEPTANGASMCIKHHWARGSRSGYNLKWNKELVLAALGTPG